MKKNNIENEEKNEKKIEEEEEKCECISELEVLSKEKEEAFGKLLRLQADFDNYKKRMIKEKSDTRKFALEDFTLKLLPILDNLDRALETDDTEGDYKAGVEMVFKQLKETLASEGISEIEAENAKFDPNYHHAVVMGNDNDVEDDIVLEVLQKGYVYNEKVIRASMVKVNKC